MPKVGISTLYLHHIGESFRKVIETLEAHRNDDNPDIWEIVDSGNHSLDRKKAKELDEIRRIGVLLSIHCPYDEWINIADRDTARRRQSIERMIKSIDMAAEIEASYLVLHSGGYDGFEWEKNVMAGLNLDSIISLFDYASNRGVAVGLENMPPTASYFMTRPDEFLLLEEKAGLRLRLTFDVGHAQIGGNSYVNGFLEAFGEKILTVHVSDNHGCVDEHLSIGDGTIDWPEVVKRILSSGLPNQFIVESYVNPYKSLLNLRQIIQKALGIFATPDRVHQSP